MHKKPTGTNGSVKISTGLASEFQKVNFPQDKAEIESFVMTAAYNVSKKTHPSFYGLISEPVLNVENDFDFSLPISSGIEYLDLAEITIGMERGGHDKAPSSCLVGELVDAAWKIVEAKECKYGTGRISIVHLLLFTTDWKFCLSPSCIKLLSLYSKIRAHQFKSIAYFAPINPGDGIFIPIFPSTDDCLLSPKEEMSIRNTRIYKANPQTAESVDNHTGIIFRF